ncbi:hypothetical protein Tco_1278887 [Tanacetum coccineum]
MQGYLQIASNLDGRIDKHASRLSALENLNRSHKVKVVVDEVVTDAVDWAMQAPLRARFSDLPAKSLERDYSNQLLADLEEARRKKRKKCVPPRNPSGSPPPQPPPAGVSGAPGTSRASGSSQLPPPSPPPSTDTNRGNQYKLASFTATQETSPTDYLMNDDSIPDEHVHLSDDEDTRNDHLPKADMRKDW